MPFKTAQHANLGYVDKQYKELLDRLCDAHKRPIKAELEYLIEQAATQTMLTTKLNTISKK